MQHFRGLQLHSNDLTDPSVLAGGYSSSSSSSGSGSAAVLAAAVTAVATAGVAEFQALRQLCYCGACGAVACMPLFHA
jgi:hypothetical protein